MQEPIISEPVWGCVQELHKTKRRYTKSGKTSLFSGLVHCHDCGAKLHFYALQSVKHGQEFFRCASCKGGRGKFTVHYNRDKVLEQVVLEAIENLSDLVRCYEWVFLYLIERQKAVGIQEKTRHLEHMLEANRNRVKAIDNAIANEHRGQNLRRLLHEVDRQLRIQTEAVGG